MAAALVVTAAACADDSNDAASATTSPPTPVTDGGAPPTGSSAPASTGAAQPDIDGPVDIGGGRSLYLHCTGRGEPTVILESGYHDSASLWSESEPTPPAVGPSVQERLSEHVQVCSYDRPGTIVLSGTSGEISLTDRSTSVSMPRPASAAVEDLHALITAAELPTPVVIVAHSMGGLLARLYTETYPDDVAGLVFVDAFPAEMRDAMGDQWPHYEEVLAHPGTPLDDDPAFEVFDVDASIDEVLAAGAMPNVPMAVITKTEPFPLPATEAALGSVLEQAWTQTSADLVALGDGTPHVVATGSDHYIQVRQPDLVADTALLVIERAAG